MFRERGALPIFLHGAASAECGAGGGALQEDRPPTTYLIS
jgi:hypothetical protein